MFKQFEEVVSKFFKGPAGPRDTAPLCPTTVLRYRSHQHRLKLLNLTGLATAEKFRLSRQS